MELTKSEEFAKELIELAGEKAIAWNEFMYSLQLAKEIIGRSIVSKQCLSDYKFPSQVDPPDISELFSVQK